MDEEVTPNTRGLTAEPYDPAILPVENLEEFFEDVESEFKVMKSFSDLFVNADVDLQNFWDTRHNLLKLDEANEFDGEEWRKFTERGFSERGHNERGFKTLDPRKSGEKNPFLSFKTLRESPETSTESIETGGRTDGSKIGPIRSRYLRTSFHIGVLEWARNVANSFHSSQDKRRDTSEIFNFNESFVLKEPKLGNLNSKADAPVLLLKPKGSSWGRIWLNNSTRVLLSNWSKKDTPQKADRAHPRKKTSKPEEQATLPRRHSYYSLSSFLGRKSQKKDPMLNTSVFLPRPQVPHVKNLVSANQVEGYAQGGADYSIVPLESEEFFDSVSRNGDLALDSGTSKGPQSAPSHEKLHLIKERMRLSIWPGKRKTESLRLHAFPPPNPPSYPGPITGVV